jgi:phosphoribosylanthranilate isomerase
MIKLKVCGMREKRNIVELGSLGVDYMGFIFYKTSPRYTGDDFKIPAIPSTIKRVGVFVNATTSEMLKVAGELNLDFLQLHGAEGVEQCEALKSSGIGLIKVFSVDDNFDFSVTKGYQQIADYFLFDTKGIHHGGNARVFNWSVLNQYSQQVPFFLSGGISINNMEAMENLKGMNLHAIDVNSGVEMSPAVKDPDKVREIKEILNARFSI